MAFAQPATFNEVWTDERVASYMNTQPALGENTDYAILYHAYKHMRPFDFERLLHLFTQTGHNLHAVNLHGLTFKQAIASNVQQAQSFIDLIDKFTVA